MIDIEKIKAAAMAAINKYTSGNFIAPEAVLELIERLEAAERDAAKWHEYQSRKKVLADRGFGKAPMRNEGEQIMNCHGVFAGRVCDEKDSEWVGLIVHGGGSTIYMNEDATRALADQLLLLANQLWPIEEASNER